MTLSELHAVSVALYARRPLPTQRDLFNEAHGLTRASGVAPGATYQSTFGKHLRALTAHWRAEVTRRDAVAATAAQPTTQPTTQPAQPAQPAQLTEWAARRAATHTRVTVTCDPSGAQVTTRHHTAPSGVVDAFQWRGRRGGGWVWVH